MKKTASYIFLSVIGIMMVVYLSCDVFNLWDSRPLKFVTSALITFFGLTVIKDKNSCFVSIGLMFTLLADVFLVLLDQYLYGVAVFIVAQLFYTVYLTKLSGKKLFSEILKRVVPAAIIAVILIVADFGGNIVLSAAYAVCIGVNIAHGIELNVKEKCLRHTLIAIGFLVFVSGDICVGLRHMPFVTEGFAAVLYFITWLTYPPGQILILMSTGALKLRRMKN